MTESHELYKEYKKAEQSRIYAEKIGSKYVDDYKQKEEIARLRYKLKDIEEKEDFDKGYKFLSKYGD
jgi:hypothetical protein